VSTEFGLNVRRLRDGVGAQLTIHNGILCVGFKVNETTDDLTSDELRNAAEDRAEGGPRRNESETGYLSEGRFNELTAKLIYVATAGGILPSDALAALAKALGTLSAFAARREGRKLNEVLGASQHIVASFAMAAEVYMNENQNADFS